MTSLFAESHNMVAILEKSDVAQGFEQIIDFLSGSYIHHALTVNPEVYISCIKQFWNTDVVKRSGDVTRLHALVDKKKIVISEEVVREILQLNDAEGILLNSMEVLHSHYPTFLECQKNFMERVQFCNGICIDLSLLRVGKGFSGVETPLFENMLEVRTVDVEEEVQVPAQDDVVQEHVIKEIATEVVPPTPTSPSPSSPIIPSTPPHQSPSLPQPQAVEGSSHLVEQVLDKCSALVLRIEGLETANAAQQLEIIKLKARVKKLERLNKVKSSKLRRLKKVGTSQRVKSLEDEENVFNQGRISVDMDQDEGVELVVDQEKDVEVEGRQADTQAEIYNIDLDHSSKVLSMQEDTEVQEVVEVVTTAKLITEFVTAAATQVAAASAPIPAAKPKVLKIVVAPAISTRKRKGVVIRDLEEELHDDTPAETPSVKDKGKGILIEDPKPMKKKGQIKMDAEFDANMKFLFKTKEEMEKEDEEIIKSINETPAQKAAKRRKLSEEAQEPDNLRGHLEIVQDEDDDVFVEAIPLAHKVPVVDYQVVVIDNKPRFTLEKLVNVARLQVEEESEMSLELLRFTRQQLCC
nr:hypothetical protein [Tanacetum cinerariifolium]